MNRAMRWLAVVALVAGLANALFQVIALNQQDQAARSNSAGLTGSFPAWYWVLGPPAIGALALLMVEGTTVLGMALAWADQRRGWLNAVVVVTLASILWPYALEFWRIVHPTLTPSSTSDGPGLPFTEQLTIFSVYASRLVPVVLVLIYSVFSRADTRTGVDNRLDADAALEITRTPL